ncbi:MAG: glycosyltransferase, partial [Bacteroidia bacterium]
EWASAAAEVVSSRAGALSSAELAIAAQPCILVPSPNVSEDHQTKNAMALVDKEAAILIKDAAATTELVPQVIALLNNEDKQFTLSSNISKLAIPNAAELIVDELLKLNHV